MCLGIPGRVVALVETHGDLAEVEAAGMTRRINIGLLTGETLRPGDWVLIHAGFAMEKIDADKARDALGFLSEYTADPPGVRDAAPDAAGAAPDAGRALPARPKPPEEPRTA
jgi:hydrogenase expression/formation protein HypC